MEREAWWWGPKMKVHTPEVREHAHTHTPLPIWLLCALVQTTLYFCASVCSSVKWRQCGATYHQGAVRIKRDGPCKMPLQCCQHQPPTLNSINSNQPPPPPPFLFLLSLQSLQTGSQPRSTDSHPGYKDPAKPGCKIGRRKVAKAVCQQRLIETD